MLVFIDTNVLLDFYQMSKDDLEEIRKVTKLATAEKLTLLISSHVVDEFTRNREGAIASSITTFGNSKVELHRPHLVRRTDEIVELEKIRQQFKQLVSALKAKVTAEAVAETTKADQVIRELFHVQVPSTVDVKVIARAKERSVLGRPPGKGNSIGDAIHWEWLIDVVPQGEDVCLVSGDGDFASELQRDALAAYLSSEWRERKDSECHFYPALSLFFREHFPDIKLADEVDRMIAVDQLEQSKSYEDTHLAVAKLLTYDEFPIAELRRLGEAFRSNGQVSRIFGDHDVLSLADRLIQHGWEKDARDEVQPIFNLMVNHEYDNSLEARSVPSPCQ